MTENKTSEAMAELPAFMDNLAKIKVWSYDVDPAGPKVARALAAKYQRMEEALQHALQDMENCIEDTNHYMQPIKDALSFDPLADA